MPDIIETIQIYLTEPMPTIYTKGKLGKTCVKLREKSRQPFIFFDSERLSEFSFNVFFKRIIYHTTSVCE